MDDRPHNKKMGKLERSPPSTSSNSRKSKKRIARQNKQLRQNNWTYEPIQPDEATQPPPPPPPPMDYGPVFYQQPSTLPPHMQQGQRLFTAMSDPSVCGYSPMPMAYAMEPVSMPPIYPLYRPVPQPNYRQFGNRTRRNIQRQPNGYSSLQENRTHYLPGNLHQNGGDYASLPPTANNDERSDADEVNSEHRRYSDPGLGPADVARDSDESDSGESASSITTVRKGSKIVLSLVEQMTNLREANSRMFKDLHDTKLSLENTKSELSRVKQQGGLEYQPGMIADIIGEMREANKILEETMTARLTAIIEEKNNERLSELYDVKERLAKMTEEKNEADKRIAKLEEEIARLKISVKNEGEIAAFEEETLALRRELQEARSASSSSSSVNRHQSSKEPTKCVIAERLSPITLPVTFNNSPCITSSTPVRTNKLPTPPSSLFSSSSSSTPPCSLSPSNSSRNVEAIYEVVDDSWEWQIPKNSIEKFMINHNFSNDNQRFSENNCQFSKENQIYSMENQKFSEENEKFSSENYKFSEENENFSKKIDKSGGKFKKIKENYGKIKENSGKIMENSGKILENSGKILENSGKIMENSSESEINWKNDRKESTQSLEPDEREALEKLINFHLQRVEVSPKPRKLINRTKSDTTKKIMKKSSTSSSSSSENDDNINDRKPRRKRGIVDIPDVVFAAGKSMVPKDLTRILTSRVLTAPSRATYTTAYI